MNIKAVLFDVDGTLLDTNEYIYQAFEHSLDLHYEPMSREILQKVMGKPLEECYRILTEQEDVTELANAHHVFQVENPHLSMPFPNTLKILKQLKKDNYSIAAVTTRARNTAEDTLDESGILPFLDYFVAIDDVANPKPHAEPVMKAVNYFGIDPAEAMMVGDSDVDVMAGKNAGVLTVGVSYGFHGESIVEADPDFVIDDISEIVEILKKE